MKNISEKKKIGIDKIKTAKIQNENFDLISKMQNTSLERENASGDKKLEPLRCWAVFKVIYFFS